MCLRTDGRHVPPKKMHSPYGKNFCPCHAGSNQPYTCPYSLFIFSNLLYSASLIFKTDIARVVSRT